MGRCSWTDFTYLLTNARNLRTFKTAQENYLLCYFAVWMK